MVGGQLLFLGSHNAALLLGACHDLHGSFLDVLHGDGLAAAAGSQQSGLIDQVLQVSTRKTCGALLKQLYLNKKISFTFRHALHACGDLSCLLRSAELS